MQVVTFTREEYCRIELLRDVAICIYIDDFVNISAARSD